MSPSTPSKALEPMSDGNSILSSKRHLEDLPEPAAKRVKHVQTNMDQDNKSQVNMNLDSKTEGHIFSTVTTKAKDEDHTSVGTSSSLSPPPSTERPSTPSTPSSELNSQDGSGFCDSKTVTPFQPAVWSEVRQPLCDANWEFYNSHQSGSHTKNGRLLGYLVDAESRPCDILGAEVVISTM